MQRFLTPLLVASVLTIARAQSNNNGVAHGTSTADQQWQAVQNNGNPNHPVNSADPASRAQAAAAYIADADALKAFYTNNPSHAEAKEAQRKEALALLYARSLGDTTQQARCNQLVATLRKDTSIDVEEREQLAAFSDNLDVEARHLGSHDQQLLALEQTARALQAEFPASSSIYESLVGIALSSADDHAAVVAHDVLSMSAPDTYKAKAQVLLNRLALKGASLADLATATLGAANPIGRASGNPVVLYTWSSTSTINLTIAKDLAAKAPAGTVFIGVCVDMGDLTSAKNAAATAQPPGEQIYDPLGFAGKFAGQAQLTSPGLIYLADRKGNLVSVSGQRDTTALLNSLANL